MLWGKTPAIRAPDQDGQDAKAPKATGHPSPYAHPAGPLRQRQRSCTSGRPYGKGNRPSRTDTAASHSHKPPSVSNAKAGTGVSSPRQPAAHQVERQRRLPKQPRHPFRRPRPNRTRSRHAARQRGSPGGGHCENTTLGPTACRTNGNDQAPRTGQSPPSKAYPGTPQQAYQRSGNATASPVHSDTAHGRLHQTHKAPPPQECRELAQQRDAKPRVPRQGTHKGRGGDYNNLPPSNHLNELKNAAQRSRLKTHRQTAIDTPGQRRRHRLSSKDGGQGDKSSEGQKEKSEKTHLWELKAHVGLGQPRTRHHAQSGRSGHPSVTVPLA
ncbi:hypothetical protein WOLCODRAFT_150347 [Wolfiporia cocos MD-104 SS10]|uniref:Uncharacterized protein n=1 Tax=Wolfiporia cocos (strain MD-104) TaxID=742152 RepID=A0A2H3JNC9_WOLCO|nr:hypothetical protein WOLCODRAFT_150347 [Wolfiporia cocos MD-104 SS10]